MSGIDLDEDALEAACKALVGEAASYHFAFFADGWTKDYVRINAKRLAEPAIREYLRLTALQSGVSEAGKGEHTSDSLLDRDLVRVGVRADSFEARKRIVDNLTLMGWWFARSDAGEGEG